MSKRAVVLLCIACLVAGYLAASAPGFDPVNPFSPQPQRPIARLLSRVARLGLWLTVFAEPSPRPVEQQYAAAGHCDGSMVCHAEGW
jgi:hypothetical protein